MISKLSTIRIVSFAILSLLLLAAAYGVAKAMPSRLVEADNPNLYIWVYSPPECTQFPTNPTGDGLENVVKNTLPMEWGPSWTEHAVKAGAVLVRTVAWEHWYDPQWNGWYNFKSQNVDKGQSEPPGCAGRMNYVLGASANYGNSSYGTNRATDNTFGFYIPSGTGVRYINWGDFVQGRTNCWATYGHNFYDSVVFAYQPAATGYCDDHSSDYTYRPAPLALESGNDPKIPHQPVLDAYMRNNGGENVGRPYNNGGGEWVHRWEYGWTQDMTGGGGGTGALMQPDVAGDKAFWVHGSIWQTYLSGGGAGWLGYPLSDEYSWPSNCGGWNPPRTDFETAYITYDCGTNTFHKFDYLKNNSFESGVSYWNLSTPCCWALYTYPPAKEGSWFLEFNPGGYQTWTSVSQDISVSINPGEQWSSSVWVRCRSGGSCPVQLALWGLGIGGSEAFSASATINQSDSNWQLVSLDMKTLGVSFTGSHNTLRFELYQNQPRQVDMDLGSLRNQR